MASSMAYDTLGRDPLLWLEQAGFLKLSANAILAELKPIYPKPQTLPGVRERKLAFIQSYMLLTGLAFENLIKGILLAKDPSLVTATSIPTMLGHGGHGIADGA